MAKRTLEQQEYRNNLAHWSKKLTEQGNSKKELAETLQGNEELTPEYFEALWNDVKQRKEIAINLIESGKLGMVLKYIDKFEIDQEIAEKIINDENFVFFNRSFFEKIDKIQWVNRLKLADKIAEHGVLELFMFQDKFEWLDHNRIFKIRIKCGNYWIADVATCLELRKKHWYHIKWLDKEVAWILIDNWLWKVVVENMECFEWLDENIVKELKRHKLGKFVDEHPEKFWLNKKK